MLCSVAILCLAKRAITGIALGTLRPTLCYVREANQPLLKLGMDRDNSNLTI